MKPWPIFVFYITEILTIRQRDSNAGSLNINPQLLPNSNFSSIMHEPFKAEIAFKVQIIKNAFLQYRFWQQLFSNLATEVSLDKFYNSSDVCLSLQENLNYFWLSLDGLAVLWTDLTKKFNPAKYQIKAALLHNPYKEKIF